MEEPFKDKLPHLYQLVVRPDNSFEIRLDHKIINEGSLLTDFKPAVNPPAEIDDPTDQKPADWDEREKIPDPSAQKPDDWNDDAPAQIPDVSAVKPEDWLDDEPDMIPDPTAVKPEDWDTEIDGEWEAPLVDNPVCEKVAGCGKWQAPLVPNPEYKGKWRAPMIENPNYQGKWAPRKIANPDFFEDLQPFKMTPIVSFFEQTEAQLFYLNCSPSHFILRALWALNCGQCQTRFSSTIWSLPMISMWHVSLPPTALTSSVVTSTVNR